MHNLRRRLLVPPARELPVRGQAGEFGITLAPGLDMHPYAVFLRALLAGRYGGHFVELWPVYPRQRRPDLMLEAYERLVHVVGSAAPDVA